MALAPILVVGLLLFGLVYTASIVEMRHWRRTLVAFRLYLPRNLTVEDATRWLATIAATTHPPRWSPFPLLPVALEAQASRQGIAHYVLVAPAMRGKLLASVQAAFPGARLEEDLDYLQVSVRSTIAQEATLTSRIRPLAIERVESVSVSLVAALQPLEAGERILIQLLMTSAGTPSPISSKVTTGSAARLWWLSGAASTDAEARRAQRLKQKEPLLAATWRIGVTAASRRRADALLSRPWSMAQGLNAPGVRLVPRLLPSVVVSSRLSARRYPLLQWPLLLNVREASALLAFPFGAHLPGLALGRARQLPPLTIIPTRGNVVGESNYPGMAGRVLALSADDRLRHAHLIGPTGTGKSTLLARMALQDIASGYSVVVVDPKGDLVSDIAARVPPERCADVVVLDPSQAQTAVVGFNPLRAVSGDGAARELIADHVLNIFHSIYREFWGPRTDEILRAALFSLTHTDAPDGSAFTLIEVPELLTSPRLRHYVCAHPALPPYLRAFWQWFDGSLSDGERAQATGPVLNKLRAFSMRNNVRLMLGQSQGVTLDHRFFQRGILLVSLAKGKIGAEAASLLGSLFVASLWQATQARINLPAEQRRPFFAYLDEFQDIVRLGSDTSLADMLAQARGLGLSLTLAHQYLNQLPGAVREATLGTVRTHVAFQLEWDDARALEARFAPLTRRDLSGLDTFEFALKPCIHGQTLSPVTGRTLPLGEPLQDANELAHASRERYGMTRPAIEAGLRVRLGTPSPVSGGRFGRETVGSSV
jgi:Type IV secretory system Conjugative DNA transfer